MYLSSLSDVKYLFGSVSLSDNYSADSKNLIVYFYNKWYNRFKPVVFAKHKFTMSQKEKAEVAEILNSQDYQEDYQNLKLMLKNYGFSIPVLFRKYTDLCERDGVHFLEFSVDEKFSNCVDAFILLQLDKVLDKKKKRYHLPGFEASERMDLEKVFSLN